MNLFVSSLADYLKREWHKSLNSTGGSKEARFIVQSLGPDEVFALFEQLENYRLKLQQDQSIKCYFRVATGLWEDWCNKEGESKLHQRMLDLGAIGTNNEREWIDEKDQLTWYRNRTTRDEGVDSLVVVLVGLGHATDQGGLSDFHQVDADRIWREMGKSFEPWLSALNERFGLSATDSELSNFNTVLSKLFEIKPLRLVKLATFFDNLVKDGDDFSSLSDLTEKFFRELPEWSIPPLLAGDQPLRLKGNKGALALNAADSFISHQRYKTSTNQNKDWKKIKDWIENPDTELPESIGHKPTFQGISEYRDALHDFIFKADVGARQRLLTIDALPLLEVLGQKTVTSTSTKSSVKAINGTALEAFTHGVWEFLNQSQKKHGQECLSDNLESISIEIVRFDHDLNADDEEGLSGKDLAKELLTGCLGGLGQIFDEMEYRLPVDSDQAQLPYDQWGKVVPISLDLSIEDIHLGTSRARPSVQFRVAASFLDQEHPEASVYKWLLPPTQPQRVQFQCARKALSLWQEKKTGQRILPTFRIAPEAMAAIYFAADEEEANRLLSQALTDLELVNLLEGLPIDQVDDSLWQTLTSFIDTYHSWLKDAVTNGFYAAEKSYLPPVIRSFEELVILVLNENTRGSAEILRRLYKAFFVVDSRVQENDEYIPAAIAWGLSPSVLELTLAQARFIADGFPEVLGQLALEKDHKLAFKRLQDLAQIHRPLSALVVDSAQQLSSEIKSFGLIHYFGPEPSTEKTLAVQTLLRHNESDDDENISEIVQPCEERDVVARVLNDYQQLYSYAEDGLRILAVNIKELNTILAGVDHFLKSYLEKTPKGWPPFHCSITVFSTSSSPMTMEGRLAQWREYVLDKHKETGRGVHLSIGHQYAPKEKVANIVAKERHAYDVAFLFHFLKDGLVGRADPALPFEHDFDDCYFPIAEYPRPIEKGNPTQRLSLISNRRLRVQTKHADMSARLRSSGSGSSDYLISGQVEYAPWEGVLEALHSKAQWVACVDPFVDKQLLSKGEKDVRKIVGFTSGLGAYGELNLTLSTEHDTLKQLTDTVSNRLSGLLPHTQLEHREVIATRVVNEAEEVIGLSSLRAVVGADERIREVIGFAAIRRLLQKPSGQMTQLIPLDSLSHWFAGSDVSKRPDLLQLTLEVRTDNVPLVHAELIECKFALNNPEHLAKACEQIEEGLSHLTSLLSPKRNDLDRIEFDRRYWWAQLHRAITSRSEVNLSKQDWRQLDHGLEQLAEGQYEIRWHSAIFTFWTNVSDPQHRIASLPLPAGVVGKPFEVENGYVTKHFQMGYQGIANVFLTDNQTPLVILDGPSICLKAQSKGALSRFAPSRTVETSNSEHRQAPSQVDQPLQTTQQPTVDQEHSPVHEQEEPDALAPADEPNVISHAPPVQPTDKPTNQAEEEPADSPPEPSPVTALDFHVPEKILIGTKGNTDRPVYWHFGHPKLANRHLLIFGASGSGKTYGIQCLLAELAMERVRSLIIDYTDGFLPAQVEPEFSQASAPKDHFVVKDKLPLNPFRRQQQEIDPSIPAMEENAYQVATRVASIFASVFPDTGSQQISSLIRVIQSGLEDDPNFNLATVLDRLRNDSTQGESLANKLEPLIQAEPFTGEDDQAWGEMLGSGDNFVHILQLKALAREIQKIVTEFALWDLWDYAQNSGSKNRPIPVVLDEIQNLNHGSDSPIDKMLREGRKFGLAMILATQTTSQFSREAQDRLFQAAHKLFFKPASTEISDFAKILADSTTGISREEWKQRLTKLEKGQCWSLGPVEQSSGTFKEEAVLVNVTSLRDRELGTELC